MKNIKGFTFIELVVSITIITLIWTSWMFYFHDFIWKQELSTHIRSFKKVISELDYKIKKQEIFDYSIQLNKSTYWYTVSQNNIGSDYIQEAIFDTLNNSWSINIIQDTSDIWEIKVYQWIKKIEQLTRNWWDTINLELNKNTFINSSLSWSKLNSLSFNYFLNNNEVKSFNILDILDSNMNSYNSLEIKNISWDKTYSHNSSQINNLPIIILFEQNWIEDRLEIN
jgi:hypothetical protein